MNILYIGTYIPTDKNIKYINFCSLAGNKFQKNIIENLKVENKIDLLSYIEYPVFPKGKEILIPTLDNIKKSENIEFIRYINLPVLKNITIYLSTLIFLFKNKKKYDIVLVYNLFPPYLAPLVLFKIINNIKVGSIVADLYVDQYSYDNILKKISKKLRFNKEKKLIKKLDFCIPITDFITKDLNFNKSKLKIEGGIDINDIDEIISNNERRQDEYKQILYTGTIDSVNGIEMLIKVSENLKNKKIKFIFVGEGPLSGLLKEYEKKLDNINYIGKVSNEECIKLQRSADLLILPRPTNQIITRYTFPSKLFEYMLSGTPTLITKLVGIGEEYYQHVNIIKEEEATSISKQILSIFENYDEAEAKAFNGRKFIIDNKTWMEQCKKINRFLEEI